MGRCNEAYSLLLRLQAADSVREATPYGGSRYVAGAYKHEQLSVEGTFIGTLRPPERQSNVSDGYLSPIVAVDSRIPICFFIGAAAAGWWSNSAACQVSRKNCIISK